MKGRIECIETLDPKDPAAMSLKILRFGHHVSHRVREDEAVFDQFG
jgi:hypothetical protein